MHDDLVREAFHLEQFTTLVAYDPKEAKKDNSAVFQEFKARYDLISTPPEAGPSRRTTRRALHQRVELLKGPSASASSSSPSKAAPVPLAHDSDNNILTPKGKGKEKERELRTPKSSKGKNAPKHASRDGAQYESASAPLPGGKSPSKGKGRLHSLDTSSLAPSVSSDHWDTPVASSETRRRRLSIEHASPVASTSKPPPRKRRKTDMELLPDASASTSYPEWPSTPPSKHRSMRATRSAVDLTPISNGNAYHSSDLPSPDHPLTRAAEKQKQKAAEPLARTSSVKRIRLIVREPIPEYTNPKQKPSPPRFDKSLTAFLSSYTGIEGRDQDEATLDEAAREKAALLEHVFALRQEGRMLLRPDLASAADRSVPSIEPQRGMDAWDYVVAAVQARYKPRDVTGVDIAASIASKVRGYWDVQNAREGKAKLQEEKRLRALAKATMKAVVGEWKKAVFHIREQERILREEEETRRGREHLDAILDQSGQILETQHHELTRSGRSRSRSSSVSGALRDERDTDEEAHSDSDDDTSVPEDGDETLLAGDIEDVLAEDGHREATEEPSVEGDGASDGLDDNDEAEEADSDDEDAGNTNALLGDVPSPLANGPVQLPSSGVSDPDMKDTLDLLYTQRPPTHLDDVLSPSSDLVVTPGSDPLFSPSVPRSQSRSASPSRGPPPKPVIDPSLRHPYDDPLFPAPEDGVVTVSPFSREQSGLPSTFDVSKPGGPVDDLPPSRDPGDATPSVELVVSRDGSQVPTTSLAPGLNGFVEEIDDPPADDDEPMAEVAEEPEEDLVDSRIPRYLRPYAVAPIEWDSQEKVKAPVLLRGVLRPYQQSGLEWLASIHTSNLNAILADEMGLGKTIQTIALLAHLACDRGIWGPHLIIVPTSVLLNWEMEFKKFLPGFKVLAYHGTTKRRKELRQGWYDKFHFNVCITSYTLASRDAHIFKRKPWYYMILDEAHMIKNFKSQRWNILLMFRSFRRLLLTGTPLQNNLTELWALLQFLMSGTNFANLKEFGEWFANPLEKAVEMGTTLDEETQQRVTKLHTVLRPYLLRRLKRDVEKELPSKYEHLVLCPLSKRQRFLYDEFMSRAQTRTDLDSGVYQKIANILMQLRKVCNHPDLFEVRPIVTSFAMNRSAIADFEIKELLVRRRLLQDTPEDTVNLELLGLRFIDKQNTSLISSNETRWLDGTSQLPVIAEIPGEPPPYDTRTVKGWTAWREYLQHTATAAHWTHVGYLNRLRCSQSPLYGSELLNTVRKFSRPLLPLSALNITSPLGVVKRTHAAIKSYAARAEELAPLVNIFAFATPPVVALDLPRRVLAEVEAPIAELASDVQFDAILHRSSVKLQIAFPDLSLLQYDCGKLQELTRLLRERKAGGHRILIFTQMTKILDILEIFLNFHGYLYLRLDGATKIEDRQYITERFNSDPRIFCFISSSRSGGVGINLTGADTVVFYDSDFNPQMDRQCEDRAHRIGQIRDVHIYRFISQHTVEEAMLRKANQKRSLDDLVIQKGEFDWRSLLHEVSDLGSEGLTKAFEEFEDTEDVHAARIAAAEEGELVGADQADFGEDGNALSRRPSADDALTTPTTETAPDAGPEPLEPETTAEEGAVPEAGGEEGDEEEEEGGTTVDYMLAFVQFDYDFFRDWRL
ncbi:hypothetical protein FA95DRAFT_1557581 [Auriscalpium vulgare]|uniref:Uncharacterized protein n=1 Tax=Auriscalpium vulgare TaxID=40419 RepID=A0ACB8RY63_9AGAM|nr:hypothetical protein FA95DRAFT_1557581 [Auriscalpium vulgare]